MIWKFACVALALGVVYLATDSSDDLKRFVAWIVALISCVVIYQTDDGVREERRVEAATRVAKEEADKLPRVIREADGCKVYAFKSGNDWHFFTRCPNSQVTTERNWKECHTQMVGKVSQTKCVDKKEVIETQEVK